MNTGLIVLIVIIAIVLILALFVISTYNALVQLRNRVKDQWAQIDVQIKRRADLIPNLVETVKGYASHEKDTLDAVVSARSKMVNAMSPEAEMEADGELTKALSKLMMVVEAYPDLKANQNFLDLQENLKSLEEKISFARQFYNDTVLSYNNKLEMFPSNIIGNMFGFKGATFFQISEADREVPQVKF